jgi:hypothetical protein
MNLVTAAPALAVGLSLGLLLSLEVGAASAEPELSGPMRKTLP